MSARALTEPSQTAEPTCERGAAADAKAAVARRGRADGEPSWSRNYVGNTRFVGAAASVRGGGAIR